jgi:hypothetical protein
MAGMAKHDKPPPELFDPLPDVATTGVLVLLDLIYSWRVLSTGPQRWTATARCSFWQCDIVPSEIANCPSQAKAIAAAEQVIRRHNRSVHGRADRRELRWS